MIYRLVLTYALLRGVWRAVFPKRRVHLRLLKVTVDPPDFAGGVRVVWSVEDPYPDWARLYS